MDKTVLYGASGHAKVVLDAMELNNIKDIFLIDDNSAISNLGKYGVLHSGTIKFSKNDRVLISIGDNAIRKKLVKNVKAAFFSIVHPKSIIAESVVINTGTFIAAGVVVNPDTQIGCHVIINTSASIDHDCKIGDFVHVAPSSALCGGISVGEGTLIGAGATVLPNVNIGSWVTVGAGAIITKDITDGATVVGTDRIIKE